MLKSLSILRLAVSQEPFCWSIQFFVSTRQKRTDTGKAALNKNIISRVKYGKTNGISPRGRLNYKFPRNRMNSRDHKAISEKLSESDGYRKVNIRSGNWCFAGDQTAGHFFQKGFSFCLVICPFFSLARHDTKSKNPAISAWTKGIIPLERLKEDNSEKGK